MVHQIARLCRLAMAEHDLDQDRLRLAVVGVPGVPDAATGAVKMAPNIAMLDEIDFSGELSKALGFDVVIENDVNLAVMGEHWGGVAQHVDDLAYVALGTGIGAGIILNGELVRGKHGGAGELGYLPFGADPFEDASLRQGALERVTATDAMRDYYFELAGEKIEVPEIFNRLDGDGHAEKVIDRTARETARALAAICALMDPEQIVFGGSIGRREELFSRIKAQFALITREPVELSISELGGKAALIGAASLGLSHVHATLLAGGVPGAEITLPPAKLAELGVVSNG